MMGVDVKGKMVIHVGRVIEWLLVMTESVARHLLEEE